MWRELSQDLQDLERKGLRRRLEEIPKRAINFSSNNYLGLVTHPHVIRQATIAARQWGLGSGASRLLSGNLAIHTRLEKRLASFKKEKEAAVFSSGYLANLGAVTALLNEKDLVLVDRLNHASLIDAARLSKAKLWVYPHKDLSALAKLLGRAASFRRKLVVTDAYFSMDGDVAPLDKLLELCRRKRALLMIDEAHSTGVFGKNGSGLTEHFGLSGKIDVVMGTLSKALGSVGGFLAGRAVLKDYLVNRSRPFIYTTAPSPVASAAALAALDIIESVPSLRAALWEKVKKVREGLSELGFSLMGSEGPIIPVLIGDTRKTLRIQKFLEKERIYAPAIRPPTVPKNTDRIRLSLSVKHTDEDIGELLNAFKKIREHV